jgi:Ca2+:H+ antiporter
MASVATQLFRIVTERWLNLLLIAAPVSIWIRWKTGVSIWVFVTAAVSLIPAAGLIGVATEHLARRSGPTLGGFLNATFGNAAELIIAIVALRAHHTEVVKASITGSIIGNLLLVFGFSCFVGGLTHGRQKFSRLSANSSTVMLFLATVALVMPAMVALISFGSLEAHPAVIDRLSFWSSIVLLGVYAAGLIFAFRSQRDPLRMEAGHAHGAHLGVGTAMTLLALATAFTAIEAEILIESLEPALKGLGMSELFAGVIVVALVGNAAEHYSAVTAARDNEMTLALEISVGSSADSINGCARPRSAFRRVRHADVARVQRVRDHSHRPVRACRRAGCDRRRKQLARRTATARRLRDFRDRVLPNTRKVVGELVNW